MCIGLKIFSFLFPAIWNILFQGGQLNNLWPVDEQEFYRTDESPHGLITFWLVTKWCDHYKWSHHMVWSHSDESPHGLIIFWWVTTWFDHILMSHLVVWSYLAFQIQGMQTLQASDGCNKERCLPDCETTTYSYVSTSAMLRYWRKRQKRHGKDLFL